MMNDWYSLDDYPTDITSPPNWPRSYTDRIPDFGSDPLLSGCSSSVCDSKSDDQVSRILRAQIVSHPLYPNLLQSYIDCQKVGAPAEVVHLLDEIRRESEVSKETNSVVSTCFGADPELDDFMETYCHILMKYKVDLSKPFDEATSFLHKIELQLNNLCNGVSRSSISDEAGGSSEEDLSLGDAEVQEFSSTNEDQELKDKLLRKYSGYISTLKNEFSKTKKKGKLPREAKQILVDWWNIHNKWPYPTEADKIELAERTGLDQKQISNWFINQRKRHWKPSDSIQFALMENLYTPISHQ